MLLTGEVFNPSNYDELMNPKSKETVLTVETALGFLALQVINISLLNISQE